MTTNRCLFSSLLLDTPGGGSACRRLMVVCEITAGSISDQPMTEMWKVTRCSRHWFGSAPPPMYRIPLRGFRAGPLTAAARTMSYRKEDDADPRFFFLLIGLALLMVWLTQQLYL